MKTLLSGRLGHFATSTTLCSEKVVLGAATLPMKPTRAGTRPPILAFAHHPWDEQQWMNRQHLLSRLALRGWPILYCTGALDIWQRGTDVWRKASWRGSSNPSNGVLLDCPGRWMPRWRRSAAWDDWAIRRYAGRVKRLMQITNGEGVAFLFHPTFWPYVEPLGLRYVAMHVYDTYALQSDWSHQQEKQLKALVDRADLITCSSNAMARALPHPGPEKARFLANGADVSAFSAGGQDPCPFDLSAIPRPRIHYAGSINRKVDLNLVSAIASARPDWQWVFVGNVEEAALLSDPDVRGGYLACRSLGNVHFLGGRESTEVPRYTYYSDVNVMCYRTRGGWWTDIYPLKLHEYLATGRPVVSSDLESVRPFADVVAIADGLDGWLRALQRALFSEGQGTPATRLSAASANSWDQRVDQLDEWLLSTIVGASQ